MKVLVSQKSYGGSEVLEIETRIRLIQQHSTSFVFEGHDSDPQIYTQYHSGLNYPGVSEAGFKAQIMNTILNLKSAEKGLQFGTQKCKMMIVGKNKENIRNDKIHVDKWMEEYIENKETGEIDLKEKYTGKVAIEEVLELVPDSGSNCSYRWSARVKALAKRLFFLPLPFPVRPITP